MNIFADTSGFFALLVKNDDMHVRARKNFSYFAENNVQLVTSSFVLVETTALLQHRIGLSPVNDFNSKILPLLEIVWVDEKWYAKAVQRLVARSNRDVSLVDALSFEIMEDFQIETAFAFDKHFEENGFRIAAFQ
ncbi:MAG: VapC toxin family PIN domain ribonuclease [Desulfobacterales bacterium CG23_combo_of_CG06-09_8_20_14_all_51_8]|nr:MAG: VapC toxin family PIN domain ribonuclease [Desulfobacterales bacterium CG23_combo_of_CG06-09_8_20_14_all_51_8]